MEFLISVIDHATGTGSDDELAAITAFNHQLREAGHWIFAGGLTAPSAAMVVDARGSSREVVEGPLHHGEDYLSGFWVISAEDVEQARELAIQASHACNRRVELRPLLG